MNRHFAHHSSGCCVTQRHEVRALVAVISALDSKTHPIESQTHMDARRLLPFTTWTPAPIKLDVDR
jgi:hypothetical protein